jgi:DNA-binding IclR family transcriptional regulator
MRATKATRRTEIVVVPETPAQRADPDFITAVARGFAVLRCFKRGDKALGNKDLATRTGLPRSTIARLTHTLCELGYLEFLPAIEKYSLATPVLAFGQAYLAGLDLRDVARPQMQKLADEVRGTVALAGNSGDDMMILELAHGNPTFALRVSVGERVTRGTSALGRAYTAGFPAETREQMLQGFRRRVSKEDWPAAERSFRAAFAEYDKWGVCLSLGDWNPDVRAVSTPMLSNDNQRAVAFAVTLPAHLADKDRLLKDIGAELRGMRDRIHHQLGGNF